MPRVVIERLQIAAIAGVGQAIQVNNWRTSFLDPRQNEVRANETGSACYQDRIFLVHHFCQAVFLVQISLRRTLRRSLCSGSLFNRTMLSRKNATKTPIINPAKAA